MRSRLKVALIRPPSLAAKWVPGLIATPPLALAYLAGPLAHHGHEVKIIDAVGEAVEQKVVLDETFASYGLTIEQILARIPRDADLIGISAMFTQEWPNIRRLATAIRAEFPDVPIVCGGEHITAEPEFSLRRLPGDQLRRVGRRRGNAPAAGRGPSGSRRSKTLPGFVSWRRLASL